MNINPIRFVRRAAVATTVIATTSIGLATLDAAPSAQAAFGDTISVTVHCHSVTHQQTTSFGTVMFGSATAVQYRGATYNRTTGRWSAWSAWGGALQTNRTYVAGVVNRGVGAWSFAFQARLYNPASRTWSAPIAINPQYRQATASYMGLLGGARASYCRT